MTRRKPGRVFAALYPPPAAVTDLEPIAAALGLARPTLPHQWHITLAFIGLMDDPSPAQAALMETERPGLRLRVKGAGSFAARRSAAGKQDTVIWAGLEGDVEALHTLAADIRTALKRHGVPYDDRPLQPHLTLGRDTRDMTTRLERLDGYTGPWWTTRTVRLVESQGTYKTLGAYS